MHIVIGLLTAVAGLIWAVSALRGTGFQFSSLNPFLAVRRWRWRRQYQGKPLYNLRQPMEVAAVLVLGVAKCEGEISAEQKRSLLEMYQQEFQIGANEASDLLLASAHLMRNEIYLLDAIDKILEPSQASFSAAQVQSLLAMMTRAAQLEGPPNDEQNKLLAAVERCFRKHSAPPRKWD